MFNMLYGVRCTLVDHLVPDTRVQGHRLAWLPLQSHEGRPSDRGARRKVWRREKRATYCVLSVGGGEDGLSLVVVEKEQRGRYPARRRIAEGVGEGRGQTFGEQAEAGVGGGGGGAEVGDGVQALRQTLHTTVQAQGLMHTSTDERVRWVREFTMFSRGRVWGTRDGTGDGGNVYTG